MIRKLLGMLLDIDPTPIVFAVMSAGVMFFIYLLATEHSRDQEYLKDHHCVLDESRPPVGTEYSVKELYLCEKDGPRGRRVWVSQ